MQSRRTFLVSSAAAGGALLTGFTPFAGASQRSIGPAARLLDLLILGGTGFIGPFLVRYAVARGHRVTIFTRGRAQADLPESVVRLLGDRNGQLQALEGKRWDAVVDDSGNRAECARVVAVSARGEARQAAVHDHAGARGRGAGGLARAENVVPRARRSATRASDGRPAARARARRRSIVPRRRRARSGDQSRNP
ncbi:MAG: NAD-dependent epimerase/dehydratase family protein [Gemmatimonadaceae bacterium]